MDNITHSLIGAALGQAGLKRRTGLGMPALIIGANIPDVDAACFFWLEGTEHLGFRRGITHGPIAWLILPLLLAAGLWWYDRWQDRRGKRPEGRLPVKFKWLFLLGLIGTLSHPLFDWFNNYGVRFLEPFSSEWFYGDTLFIIDLWILLGLGLAVWLSRRREQAGREDWTRPAVAALAVLTGYIGVNNAVSVASVQAVRTQQPGLTLAMANPVPVAFWQREVLWRSADGHFGKVPCGFGTCDRLGPPLGRINMADPRIARWAKGDPQAEAFLFWSRMPIAAPGPKGILLTDQRFMDVPTKGNFMVELKPR